MQFRVYKSLGLLSLMILLTACGSDGEDKTTPIPTAVATASLNSVNMGSTVQLDGSGSSAPDGVPAYYGDFDGSAGYQPSFVDLPEVAEEYAGESGNYKQGKFTRTQSVKVPYLD